MGSKLDLHGDDFLDVLMRRQFTLSCTIAGVLAGVLAAIPLMNRFVPHVMDARALGLPVSWWVLGVGVFPVLVGLGWAYVRWSNDFEDEAIGMVDIATLPNSTRDNAANGKKR